jgi:uncharacterized protein involved in exopolysaccharide biosynthesis
MSDAIYRPNAEGDLDLATLFAVLWRRRWLISACTFFFAAVFVAIAFMATPLYRAETVLVPGEAENRMNGLGSMLGQFGGLAAIAGLDVGSNAVMTEEALAVLRSRDFTETFLREEALMPVLYAKRWNAAAKQWTGPVENHPTYAEGSKFFNGKVSTVTQDKKRGLIVLQIEWKDRELAAEWANKLVKRLNAEMRARAIAQTDASVTYLEKELTGTNVVETRQAISRLMEAQVNQRMYANVAQEYAFRVVAPALPPDAKDKAWPNKPLLLLLGAFLGLMIGLGAAFSLWAMQKKKARGVEQH